MSGTSSRTYLNTYTLVPVAGQPGAYTISVDHGISTVTDTSNGAGDNTTVLGDVPNDTFTAGGSTETYSGYGVALFPSGNVALEGPIGVSSSGAMTLYTESTIAPGTVVQLETVEPGSQNEWSLTGNDPTYCFMAGTLIRTPDGDVAVEALKAGDLVVTAEGGAQPVRWIGRQSVAMRFADALRVGPVRVKAGALGPNTPSRDLLLSPDHALFVDGVLAQAGALVNGRSILRETDVPESFTYFHVELAEHALILAEGAAAETFIDNVDRLGFDNWSENKAAGRDVPSAKEMEHPRAKSQRQVPTALRARLEARADVMFGVELTKAA